MLNPSNCKPGKEQYIEIKSSVGSHLKLIQYDYRTIDGHLFSCMAYSIEDARAKRNEWLKKKD